MESGRGAGMGGWGRGSGCYSGISPVSKIKSCKNSCNMRLLNKQIEEDINEFCFCSPLGRGSIIGQPFGIYPHAGLICGARRILGGLGFLGRNLVKYIIDNNLASFVRIVDKKAPFMSFLSSDYKVSILESQHVVECIQADVSDDDMLEKSFFCLLDF